MDTRYRRDPDAIELTAFLDATARRIAVGGRLAIVAIVMLYLVHHLA